MKALFAALITKYSGSALYTALGGTATDPKLYNSSAPQTAVEPFCVFTMVSGVPEGTFTELQENTLIQFSLFDAGPSPSTICDNYELLTALFDDCELSISGYRHLYMQRESQQLIRDPEDPGTWQYLVEYRILIEKDR